VEWAPHWSPFASSAKPGTRHQKEGASGGLFGWEADVPGSPDLRPPERQPSAGWGVTARCVGSLTELAESGADLA
jgi:hypothetical protein